MDEENKEIHYKYYIAYKPYCSAGNSLNGYNLFVQANDSSLLYSHYHNDYNTREYFEHERGWDKWGGPFDTIEESNEYIRANVFKDFLPLMWIGIFACVFMLVFLPWFEKTYGGR